MYRLKIEDLCKNRILPTVFLGNNNYMFKFGQGEPNPELAGPSRQDTAIITDASAKKMITCIDPFHKFVFELIIQTNFYPQTSLT